MRVRCFPRLAGVGRPDHVALTFDDGPGAASTPRFMDRLDELGWKATFFLLGSQVKAAPGVAAELAARGHELAVHGWAHTNHLLRPAGWVTADLAKASDEIGAVAGWPPRWFRPPYGALAASSLVAAHRCGLQPVLWTTWGRDWEAGADPAAITDRVESARGPGATVLLHDADTTAAPGAWKATLAALPLLAERWAAAGVTVGPLADHDVGGRTAGGPAGRNDPA